MELTNDFEVGAPIDVAWSVLTDLERIAPCLPGAKLEEIEGEEYRGSIKVKVGPITAQYKGAAHFVEKQEAERVVLSASGRDTRGQGNASATITASLEDAGGTTKVHVVTDLNITGKVAQFGRGVMVDVSAKLMQQFVDNLEKTVLSEHEGSGDAAPSGDDAKPAKPAAKKATKKAAAKKAVAKKAVKKVAAPAAEPPAEGSAAPEPKLAAETPAETPDVAPVSGNGSGIRKIDSPEPEPVDLMEAAGSSVAKRVVPLVIVAVVVFLVIRRLRRRKREG